MLMMNIKKYIPNIATLGNLFCGTMAAVFAAEGAFKLTAILVILGVIFDFFDGFLARILNVSGELGKQLDSLADMVTSGVVPGVVMFSMFNNSTPIFNMENTDSMVWISLNIKWIQLFGFLLTLSAAYRLAKFNIDTKQTSSFIGLPTPAMSLFVVSLPLIADTTRENAIKEMIHNPLFLLSITLFLSYLMNSNLKLLSLKFKNYSVKEHLFEYLLILTSIVLILTLDILAIPLIISVYIVLSIVQNLVQKNL